MERTGDLGFEPRLTAPEAVVLPLHQSPKEVARTFYFPRRPSHLTRSGGPLQDLVGGRSGDFRLLVDDGMEWQRKRGPGRERLSWLGLEKSLRGKDNVGRLGRRKVWQHKGGGGRRTRGKRTGSEGD